MNGYVRITARWLSWHLVSSVFGWALNVGFGTEAAGARYKWFDVLAIVCRVS
jgi:hypothetical protein